MMTESPSGRCEGRRRRCSSHRADRRRWHRRSPTRGVTERHRQDSGIGHDDVEATEVSDAGFECVAQFGPLPHVGLAGDDASMQLLDRSLGLGQVLGRAQGVVVRVDLRADVDGDDVGTLCAIRIACALPCPRAAPVMKATLPSKRPVMRPPWCPLSACQFKSCGSRPCPSSGCADGSRRDVHVTHGCRVPVLRCGHTPGR